MRQDSFSSQFVCLCKGKIFILETQLFYHAPNFERNFQSADNKLTAILRSCLGRIRTLTGGTRIRRATITPQGNYYRFACAKL